MYVLLTFTAIFALNVGFKRGGNEIIYISTRFCRCFTDVTAFIFNDAQVKCPPVNIFNRFWHVDQGKKLLHEHYFSKCCSFRSSLFSVVSLDSKQIVI